MDPDGATGPDSEEIRAFVLEHFARVPTCDFAQVANGWRVKFGRRMDSREEAQVRAIYDEEDVRRRARLAAARAEAEARRPKGLARFLYMGWIGQMLLGTVIFLVGLYGGAMAFYPWIPKGTLTGGTAATGGTPLGPALSPASSGLLVSIFEDPGFQAATSFLFWTVLVTGGVGAIVILLLGWIIGAALLRALRAVFLRPRTESSRGQPVSPPT